VNEMPIGEISPCIQVIGPLSYLPGYHSQKLKQVIVHVKRMVCHIILQTFHKMEGLHFNFPMKGLHFNFSSGNCH